MMGSRLNYLHDTYRVSERRACRVARLPVSTFRYESRQEPRTALRLRIREIAQTRVRYGYRKIRVLLNREGWKVGKKLVYRLYREEGLTLRHKPRKRRRASLHRRERFRPTAPNQVWSLDFVADQLADGRRFRALTILDVFTRESLAIEVGQSLKGEDVVRSLNAVRQVRGAPKLLFCDNGSEFTSQSMDLWAYHNQAHIDFSRPGKPTDNAYVESFNGTLRAECLDVHWFASLTEARQIIEAWRREYNESRPHRSLGERTPHEFARQLPETNSGTVTENGDRSLRPKSYSDLFGKRGAGHIQARESLIFHCERSSSDSPLGRRLPWNCPRGFVTDPSEEVGLSKTNSVRRLAEGIRH